MDYRIDLPDLQYLSECFTPDFDNGFLVWNNRPQHHFNVSENSNPHKAFNTKFAGELAGSFSKYSGYMVVTVNSVCYLQHRILWKMYYKEEPPMVLDHIDEDKTNNKISNLQNTDRKTNKVKSTKVHNGSGFRGVYKRKDRGSYEVRVSLHDSKHTKKKDLHVGYYADILEAAAAYNIAIRCLGYDTNYFNVVDFDENQVNTNKKFFKEVYHHTH